MSKTSKRITGNGLQEERNNMNQGEIAKNGRVDKQELEVSGMKYEVTTDDDGLIDTVVTRRNSEQDDGVVVVGVSKKPVCEEIASNVPFAFIPTITVYFFLHV